MAKRPDITTVSQGYYGRVALNQNFENLQEGFDNTLSLDGSAPNAMNADLDMNSNDILNASSVDTARLLIDGDEVRPSELVLSSLVIAQEYATVAALLASTDTYTAGAYVHVVEGDHYYKAAASGDVTNAGGQQFEVVPLYANGAGGMYVAAAFGGTLDESAAQAAFDAAVADSKASGVIFAGDWRLASTVTISDPQNLSVDARAARFTLTADTLMFDLNGRADPTYSDNESRQNFHWKGGRFGCTVATPTKATAMRALGFRHASIEVDDFGLTSGGFYHDIIVGGKDSVYIKGHKTFDCVRSSIFVPPWSAFGGPLNFTFEKLHHSLGGGGKAIESYLPLTDCVLRDNSYNLGTNSAQVGVIDVNRYVLVGVASTTGTFTAGEVVTGGTSGATADVVEVYEHDFAFQVSQNTKWLVLENRSGTFVAGETLTGGTSSATTSIPADTGYLVQDSSWSGFNIEGLQHWESGSGSNGAVCVRLRDREGTGRSPENFKLDLGSVGVNGGGAIGLLMERIGTVEVGGRFAQTSGSGTPIKLNSSCNNIYVLPKTFFSSGVIDLNGMSRDKLNLSAFNVTFILAAIVTGWTPKALSTTTATILDMSADFPSFATVGGLPPKAYEFRIQARDSGSSGAATNRPRFRMYRPGEVTSTRYSYLGLSNIPNDDWRGQDMLVGADDNGDVEYDALATGAGTLDVSLTVTGMRY